MKNNKAILLVSLLLSANSFSFPKTNTFLVETEDEEPMELEAGFDYADEDTKKEEGSDAKKDNKDEEEFDDDSEYDDEDDGANGARLKKLVGNDYIVSPTARKEMRKDNGGKSNPKEKKFR